MQSSLLKGAAWPLVSTGAEMDAAPKAQEKWPGYTVIRGVFGGRTYLFKQNLATSSTLYIFCVIGVN